MGIFDRKKRTENQVNRMPDNGYLISSIGYFEMRYNFASPYVWMVLSKIFAGLRNVRFVCEDENNSIYRLINFLENNKEFLFWQYISSGYYCIGLNGRKDGGYDFYIPKKDKIRTGANGEVTNFDVVGYSDTYKFSRKSHLDMLNESMKAIDVYKNGDINLTEHYGCIGILSGKEIGSNRGEREEFEARLREHYKITSDKGQILLTNMPLDFHAMNMPVKDLELMEKIREEVKLIAGFFNVPYDIIPFSGASTYANQENAIRSFYSDCVSSYAEVILSAGRYIMRKDRTNFIPSDKLTFTIDNVPELKDDRTPLVEYNTKLVDLIIKGKSVGLDMSRFETELTERENG